MARHSDDYDKDKHDAGWLIDQLRMRDREIAELRAERDQQTDLIRRFDEYEDDHRSTMEQWQQAFDMQLNDDGEWSWSPFVDRHNDLVDRWNALVKDWNRYARFTRAQDVGRPLAASDAQVQAVLKLRKASKSLRDIEIETGLSLRTVRTITGKADGSDRTTCKHRDRILLDKAGVAHEKAQRRTRAALPGQIARVIETGQALVKEAKGLGRAK
jgi:hypothetical protein